jgi:hypothetical protein
MCFVYVSEYMQTGSEYGKLSGERFATRVFVSVDGDVKDVSRWSVCQTVSPNSVSLHFVKGLRKKRYRQYVSFGEVFQQICTIETNVTCARESM